MIRLKQIIHHPILSQPFIPVALTALSLLLLILVLLSVPGPIKGLYWFSIRTEDGGSLSAGVMGWCMSDTSNCTYASLSDNEFLSNLINNGESLLVKTLLPLTCYWMIISFLFWIALVALLPIGYRIKNLDSILKHLRFSFLESFVICINLFGNILSWLALGMSRNAFNSIKSKGGRVRSGNVMETVAVASFISLLSLLFAIWSLHLRLTSASKAWKQEAVLVRRRSMALHSQGLVNDENVDCLGIKEEGDLHKRLSIVSKDSSLTFGGVDQGGLNHRNSIYKATYQPQPQVQPHLLSRSSSRTNNNHNHVNHVVVPQENGEEQQEHLDEISQDQVHHNDIQAIRRYSLHDSPYTAAHSTPN